MKIPSRLLAASTAGVFACAVGFPAAIGQAADNTRQNRSQSPTADNQPNSKSDRLTTASIRKALIADKDLSTYAHNVKIITANGQVTLEGPVKSDAEKQQVLKDTTSVVSADKVTNELTVKP